MPFEIGNQQGKRQRVFADAIRKRIVQNPDDLPKVIEAMFMAAQSGDVQAATWLRDSSDGKPQQQVSIESEDGKPLFQAIKMVIVANNSNQINGLANDPDAIEGELVKEKITVSDNREGQCTGVHGPVDETPSPHLRVPHHSVAEPVIENHSVAERVFEGSADE